MPRYLEDRGYFLEIPDEFPEADDTNYLGDFKNWVGEQLRGREQGIEPQARAIREFNQDEMKGGDPQGLLGFLRGLIKGDISASDIAKGTWEGFKDLPNTIPDWSNRVNSDDPDIRTEAILEGITAIAGGAMGVGPAGGAGTTGMFIGPKGRLTRYMNDEYEGYRNDDFYNEQSQMLKNSDLTRTKQQDLMWQVNGAFQGKDGGWRTEISDDAATIDEDFFKNLKRSKSIGALGKLFNHPELYKYYPGLKNLAIEVHPKNKNFAGQFFPDTNKIVIFDQGAAENKRTLIHELQHAIQFKENWARGGPADAGRKLYDDLTAEEFTFNKAASERIAALGLNEEYKRFISEAAYHNIPYEERLIAFGEKYDIADAEYNAYANAFKKSSKLTDKFREYYTSLEDDNEMASYEIYRRLEGEIEARNVERRLKGSPGMQVIQENAKLRGLNPDPEDIRKRNNPYRTQDVRDGPTFIYNVK